MKLTKDEQKKERLFKKEVEPLMDSLQKICDKHNMPFIVAVQLFSRSTEGFRMSAQSVETKSMAPQLMLSANILRGKARITALGNSAFLIALPDADDYFEPLTADVNPFDTEMTSEVTSKPLSVFPYFKKPEIH